MLYHFKLIKLSTIIIFAILLTACSSGGEGTDNNGTNEVINTRIYYPSDSVVLTKNDSYRAIVENTKVTLVTIPETEETKITIHSGEVEVIFN